MNVLLIDNYDSFTYNLVHLIEKDQSHTVHVIKNDKIDLQTVSKFDKILLSPGPGLPKDAGLMPKIISEFKGQKSIFGVCLGMQAIGEHFGCSLKNLNTVMHGIASPVEIISSDTIFNNLPNKFNVGRYHSWVVDKNSFSHELEITAIDANGEIMALKHKSLDVRGVQFHPESILSEFGDLMIQNWLSN